MRDTYGWGVGLWVPSATRRAAREATCGGCSAGTHVKRGDACRERRATARTATALPVELGRRNGARTRLARHRKLHGRGCVGAAPTRLPVERAAPRDCPAPLGLLPPRGTSATHSPLDSSMGSSEEVRHCIRALVGVIRSASQGSSPVDDAQLAHLRKVVRLLSLSDEQIAAMRPEDREQVNTIRRNAVNKMLLANNVRKGEPVASMGSSPHTIMVAQASTSPASQTSSFQGDSSSPICMPPPPPRPPSASTPFPMAPPPIPNGFREARSAPSSIGSSSASASSSSSAGPHPGRSAHHETSRTSGDQ
ncbi:hypothetical protein AB1Y20_010538 [Prymnesium parvum]|uniref:Uncharacterized protein n=1 Tax=Prymnesium parvum TaxID=97485 RepID=A0AB34ISI9_PRYPA